MGGESYTEDLLTIKEAAARRRVAPSTLYRAVAEGRLAKVVLFGRILIHRDDLAAYEPCYDPPYARGKR